MFPILVTFLVFGIPLLFQGKTLSSVMGNHWGDPWIVNTVNGYNAAWMHQVVLKGEWPFWNPNVALGQPMIGDPSNSFLSPFSLLWAVFPNSYGHDLVAIIRILLLMGLFYGLCREIGLGKWLSGIFSALFGFSGHWMLYLTMFHANSSVFLALPIWGTFQIVTNKNVRAGGIKVALGLFLMLIGGGPLDLVLTFFFCGLTWIWSVLFFKSYTLSARKIIFSLLWGSMLAAPFLIAFWELKQVSIPTQTERSFSYSNSPWNSIAMLFHRLAFTPADASDVDLNIQQFMHLIALPGFFCSFFLFKSDSTREKKMMAAALLTFFFFYAFKQHAAPWMEWVKYTPLLREVKFLKYQGVYAASFYLLSALGYEFVLNTKKTKVLLFTALFSALLPVIYCIWFSVKADPRLIIAYSLSVPVFCLCVWQRWQLLSYALCIGIIFLEYYQPLPPRSPILVPTKLVQAVAKEPNVERIFAEDTLGIDYRSSIAIGLSDVRTHTVFQENRLYYVFKNHIDNNLCWHWLFYCTGNVAEANLAMMRFLGVSHLILRRTHGAMLLPHPLLDFKVIPPYTDEFIGSYRSPFPLLSFHTDYQFGTKESALNSIVADPSKERTIVVEAEGVSSHETAEKSTIEKVQTETMKVSTVVHAARPGYLLMRQSYYPGWRTLIDGKWGNVVRADYLFQAAFVSEGRHEVAFYYLPLSLILGFPLMLLGALGLWATSRKKVI